MSIDLSKIKSGDEVTVRCVVKSHGFAGSDLLHCTTWSEADEGGPTFMVCDSEIVSHTPKVLSVGDRVKVNGATGFEIKAEHNGVFWCVRQEPLRFESAHLSVIERADD